MARQAVGVEYARMSGENLAGGPAGPQLVLAGQKRRPDEELG